MKVKDIIEKINNIEALINKLEDSNLDYASDIIWELECYENVLKNSTVKEVY